MTKAHSTLKITITKTRTVKPRSRRSLTIGYSPNGGQHNPRPQLTIKGRWLEAFGFTTGQQVTIDAQQGLLVIRIEGQC
ncbi:type I toxin-antitoxin system SymE family toxin [Frischella perrara]|uniref:Type I toxin-antitoxin system SymE family toxin n=1 Tax=Frischella perrara TaxID=1267021 RepID=A0A318MUT6_FRIPE|nr:SymE family type I addiction module toxin [Frischella perrara]PXY94616.1 type I toxin-antitoxin system SymE family toxin [Frischella perrara]